MLILCRSPRSQGAQAAVPQGEEGQAPGRRCGGRPLRLRGHRQHVEPGARGGAARAAAPRPAPGRGRRQGRRRGHQGLRSPLQRMLCFSTCIPPLLLLPVVSAGYTEIQDFELSFDVQQDGVNFVDDGIRIEPFNLEREREEGYFDENGNFVEYARGNEIKVMKILCLVLLMSYDKLLLVTQAPVFCRMPGWIVWKLTQHMLQRYRKKAKRR